MTDSANKPTAQFSIGTEIHAACAEFQAAYERQELPRIEDFLARVPAEDQTKILAELLRIDIAARRKAGQTVSATDYYGRFPDDREAILAAFEKAGWNKRLGDYELIEELGRGGMGVVYKAKQIFLNQFVAIKVLPERCLNDSQIVARFRREMQSIGTLQHPNIVRAYNAGEAQGQHFLVMEYVDGINAHQLIDLRTQTGLGPLGIGAACEIIRQAALGLHHAHEHGLVHRDVKPANLMISRSGTVKLLDLGLAKLHADRMAEDQRSGQLTQTGMTMGTIDYMAPEQWENSSSVDIRADIYSLGCTLFYLLAGRAPFDDPQYDSSRKRLMAHVVAPVPQLPGAKRGPLQDVNRLLGHMLAKEPDDRFETPGELAEAAALLANPDELIECLRSVDVLLASSMTMRPGFLTPTAPSSRRASGSSKRFELRPRRRWPKWIGLAAVAAVAIAAGIWLMNGRDGEKKAEKPSTGPTAAQRREQIAFEVATLPGLNGGWWIDESPWLTPAVRKALYDDLRDEPIAKRILSGDLTVNPALNPNTTAAERWLLDAARGVVERGGLSKPQQTLFESLLKLAGEGVDDNTIAKRLNEEVEQFRAGLGGSGPPTAVDLYTIAVLGHKAAMIAGSKAAREEVLNAYKAAEKAFSDESAASPLSAMCHVDYGRFLGLVLQNYAEAREQFRAARETPGAPVLLYAESLVDEGIVGAAANPDIVNKYGVAEQLIEAAHRRLEKTPLGGSKPYHPFFAHVHERAAWTLIDQWNVRKANQEFEEARNIRLVSRENNDYAQIYVFHNEHGMAMSLRYFGDVNESRDRYGVLVSQIETALDKAAGAADRIGQQRLLRDLRERLSNSLERRADCDLYQGDRSAPPEAWLKTADFYEKARKRAEVDDPSTAIAMAYKRCIALALAGKLDAARQETSALAPQQEKVLGIQQERDMLLRRLCEAVLAFSDPANDRAARREALRGFLKSFDINRDCADRHRRETQEMQLLAAELLVADSLKSTENGKESLADSVAYLDRLIEAFPYRETMLPYLRRYYNLAIEAAVKAEDADRAVGYALAARGKQLKPNSPALLFWLNADRGFALLKPATGPSRSFALGFGRDGVKNHKTEAGGKSIELPAELLSAIRQETAGGRRIAMFWSDAECWPKAEEAIAKSDWPFGASLPLNED